MYSKAKTELVRSLRQIGTRTPGALNVPRSFVAFAEWLGVTLTPGQAELARVLFDAAEPVDRALAERIFGPVDFGDVPVGCRSVVAVVAGARGGKSYVAIALRLVQQMYVCDLRSLAPGQRAIALNIAPNEKLRREVLNYARGAVRSKPELESTVVDEGSDGFGVRRPDGYEVRFETGVATQGGYGARGRSLVSFALDESAFFRDQSFKVNDVEVFRAGTARVLPGGQTIVASTPWAKSGLLYELYRDNWGHPRTALVAHAPTLVMHDSEMTRAIVERERSRDPENASREYDAVFMSSGTSTFFPDDLVEACIDESLGDGRKPEPGDQVCAGLDMGLRADSSALAVVHMRKDVLSLAQLVELRPEPDAPLKPSHVVRTFAKAMREHGCTYAVGDNHYREAVTEYLDESQLSFVPGPSQPADAYMRARALMREGRVRLPRHDRLLAQLREVQGKPTSGGGMSIHHPRWATGGHGDLVAALVLALNQLVGDETPKPKPKAGTSEYEEALVEQRHRRWQEEHERPWWASRPSNDRGAKAWWRR